MKLKRLLPLGSLKLYVYFSEKDEWKMFYRYDYALMKTTDLFCFVQIFSTTFCRVHL